MHRKYKLSVFILLTVLAAICSAFVFYVQHPDEIILHHESRAIIPSEFYIANVTDERTERRAIAWLIPFSSESTSTNPVPVDLDGGGINALQGFFKSSVAEDRSLRPVTIRVTKFMVKEHLLQNGQAQGNAVLQLSFDAQQDDQSQHLIDYTGGADYTRNAGPPQDIEPTLRKMLISGLSYFNTWINRSAAGDIRLAKSVRVSFHDYNEVPEGDTIYYSVKRPLNWSDFKGAVPQSRFSAEVSPTIGYDESVQVKNSVVELNIGVKAYLPKSACWVKPGARDDYTLNHEQRHFDIAKIASINFERKLGSETLPASNYDGTINEDYLDAYRRMDTLELKYDTETQHGMDHDAQQQWNERIDKELKALRVK